MNGSTFFRKSILFLSVVAYLFLILNYWISFLTELSFCFYVAGVIPPFSTRILSLAAFVSTFAALSFRLFLAFNLLITIFVFFSAVDTTNKQNIDKSIHKIFKITNNCYFVSQSTVKIDIQCNN